MNEEQDVQTKCAKWGLPLEEIRRLPERLLTFHQRYSLYMRTPPHDKSEYGLNYMSGLLRIETDRTIANIGRKVGVSIQNMHHFISKAPWSGRKLVEAIQEDVKANAIWQSHETLLVIDESSDEKAGEHSAGAGRQHNGRLGKIEMSQTGVFVALANEKAYQWVDGELFVPEAWFAEKHRGLHTKAELPAERTFQTKPELAWELIARVRAKGMPFVAVAMDDLYGRNLALCVRLDQEGIEYYGDVPANTHVYLEPPRLEHPLTKRGKPSAQTQVMGQAIEVRQLLTHAVLQWQTLPVRTTARGFLLARYACCRVWLVHEEQLLERWLLLRHDAQDTTYTLSNAPADTALDTLARRRSYRAFIESANQDAKRQLGWDEFQAIKYRAWEHHLALTILANWFITQTRLEWMERHPRSPDLFDALDTDALPPLSVANVRTLLAAAMPLPQLTTEQAAELVIAHLVNRTRSRNSFLRKQLRSYHDVT